MSKLYDLSPKHRRFAEEYLIDLNATQAAIRAGYSANSASEQAYDLLRKPQIAAAIQAMVKKRSDRTEVRADQVIAELVHLAFANALDYVTIGEDGEPFYDLSRLTRDQGSAVAEITLDTLKTGDRDPVLTTRTRVKLHPKLPALLELGKHLGLFKGGAAGRTPNATEHPPDLLAKDDPLRVDVIERFAKAAEKWAKPASQTGKAT